MRVAALKIVAVEEGAFAAFLTETLAQFNKHI